MELKILCAVFLVVLAVVTAYENPADQDPAIGQLVYFKKKHPIPVGIMTTASGAPINYNDTITMNKPLIINEYFMDSLTHFVRQRPIERVVHAKAAGAFGYFEVTHDLSDICKAKLFSKVGERTPIAVRFSPTHQFNGGIDTSRDSRGFAVKFYSKEGNFDTLGFHTPMFVYKDPILFPIFSSFLLRNAVTNLLDPNMFWDAVTLHPESLFIIIYLFGDKGIPDGYRFMPGFSIHTYQVSNKLAQRFFIRFHFKPDAGEKYLNATAATAIAGTDQDYAVRDLFTAIGNGNFPRWTLYVQVLSEDDLKNADFDVFDVTKILPENKYPLRKVGKLVLNQNPQNHYAQINQIAFGLGNLVPGIQGGPDIMFQARRFVYRDAQLHRLGANLYKIPVNKPCQTRPLTYNRDGVQPTDDNYGDMPIYYPNSFNGPKPYVEPDYVPLIECKQDPTANNFDQVRDYYNKMSRGEKTRLIENIMETVSVTTAHIQQRLVNVFSMVHEDLAYELQEAIDKYYEKFVSRRQALFRG